MKFGTVIPAGYMLEITTWENDADHYKTIFKTGLQTKEEVNQYLWVLSHCRSSQSRSGNNGFGNEDYDKFNFNEFLENSINDGKLTLEFANKVFYYEPYDEAKKDYPIDEYDQLLAIQDLLGDPVEYDYDFIRVCENISVRYLAEPIAIPEPSLVETFNLDYWTSKNHEDIKI